MNKIVNLFNESINLKKKIIKNKEFAKIEKISNQISKSLKNKNKLLICGNGGSAADAQHLAAELLIRLRPTHNRGSIPAISLAMDPSTLTACGNDYSFDDIYKRNLSALGQKGDCLLVLSTSGNSKNILNALKVAKKMNINCFGFLGNGGGKAKKYCDISFIVPSKITGRIQECHITAGHALMENVEDNLIEDGFIKLK